MTADARPLAAALTAAPDAEVAALLRARGIVDRPALRDFFDLAEVLLEPTHVADALAALPADLARAIATADPSVAESHRAALQSAALIGADGAPYEAVRVAVATLPVPDLPATRSVASVDSATAAERAFTSVSAVADLLLATYAHPIATIGSGAIGAADRRRLLEEDVVAAPEDVDAFVEIAAAAGLLRQVDREWQVTAQAHGWLNASTPDRWRSLALGLAALAPEQLHDGDAWTPVSDWLLAYPWSPTWPTRAAELSRDADLLGLFDPASHAPTPWAAGDAAALSAHLPAEVDRVFLQNDLSVIAPGPLAPELDLRLRSMAVRESHAQASTYRFTAASVQNALSHGESATSITDFLGALSLTGVPQPLSYLVQESATRHGSITVSTDAASGRTRVRTANDTLREMLAVDQTLRSLGLVVDVGSLSTRVDRDLVALALAEAHYPVAVVDSDGRFEPLQRGRVAPETDDAPDASAALVTRLRESGGTDVEHAWLMRELDAAVRAKALLEVTVAMPGGESRTLLLEAAGLGGGRLRGRDRAADVERTLPLSHITHVTVVR
ncbi:helicase-associated domain-containing protein [Microbacterium gorillae]|uniref:helicase-associated domain-containing protein n=1 Tax=Microbacterium gorillae TaxID=1231063 RepID=UPI00058B15C8|nr:helicase-associated domain-containing protein [Microbacterium gorillae]